MAQLYSPIPQNMASALAAAFTGDGIILSGSNGLSITLQDSTASNTITFSNNGSTTCSASNLPLSGTANANGTLQTFNQGAGNLTGTIGASNADLILFPVDLLTGQGVNITSYQITVEDVA